MELSRLTNPLLRGAFLAAGAFDGTVSCHGRDVHHYVFRGEGQVPLVLLHGLASSAGGYLRVARQFRKHFSTVYVPELPGHGHTRSWDGAFPSFDDVLDVFADYLGHIEAPCVLLGNSLGGGLAFRLAHRRPDRVRALVLFAPAGARVSDERFHQTVRQFRVESNRDARVMLERLFHRAPRALLPFSFVMKSFYGTPVVKTLLQRVSPEDAVEPEVLRALTMPTLLLWGQSEKVLPYEGVHYFREHLPSSANVAEVEGYGHLPHIETPGDAVRRVVEFLRDQGLCA